VNTLRALQFILLVSLVPSGLPAQVTDTLTDDDLNIAGLTAQTDTQGVRRVLGAPSRVDRPDSVGAYKSFSIWRYPRLKVVFNNGQCDVVEVIDSSFATKRGARVGDQEAKIRRLYGRPMHANSRGLVYVRSFAWAETRGIVFSLDAGRVSKITVGNVASPD